MVWQGFGLRRTSHGEASWDRDTDELRSVAVQN